MGRFLQHEPCPKCGSRDNLARYDDGSAFCFGCHHYEARTNLPKKELENASISRTGHAGVSSWTSDIHSDGTDWLHKYGIGIAEFLKYGGRWNTDNHQIIFPFKNEEGNISFYQARNFNPKWASKAKYYNVGSKEEIFPFFNDNSTIYVGNFAVLTEDVLSAIKIARQVPAMPLFGITVSLAKLVKLKRRGVEKVIVWLDRDKWREANEIADLCKWIGMASKTILTDLDPKEYSNEEIWSYINDS